MRLGDMLIKQNVLTEDELKKALELQKGSGKKIGEVLVDNGFITEDMIVRALQMQLGLKVVQLTGVTIPKEVRNLVSVDILKKYTCIPFELDPYNANILHLAMADPMDMAAIDDIYRDKPADRALHCYNQRYSCGNRQMLRRIGDTGCSQTIYSGEGTASWRSSRRRYRYRCK